MSRRSASCILLLAIAGCGPTKEDWKLAPPRDPGTIGALEMVANGRPATLPTSLPTKFPATRPAVSEAKLNLAGIRAMALRNNLDLKVAVYSPEISRTFVSQEEAKFESTFFTDARVGTSDPAQLPSAQLAPQSDSASVEPGINIPLRTGGTLSFSSPLRTDNINNDRTYSDDILASISQPLLRNAGQEYAEYSVRIAGYQSEISRVQSRLQVTTVLAAVDRTYWRLYASRRQLEVRKQQYDLAGTLLERSRRLVAAGQAAQIEITRSESGLADQLDAIITADNVVRERQRELKRLLNEPEFDEQTAIIPGSDPNPIHFAIDSQHLVDSAMQNRSELLQAQLQLAQDALTIGWAKNQTLPSLLAAYTYRIHGTGETPADAYDMSFQKNFDDHTLSLRLEVPIGNEAAKSQLRRALLQRQQDLSSKAAQSLQIRKDVLDSIDSLEAAWNRIIASRARTILANRTLEAEQRQFEQGLRTATDVLDAQTRLADAQSSEISALTDYEIAQIDLAFATGTLLGQARVDWETQIPTTQPTE